MEKRAEKQVAFARSCRSFATPAPSVWDFCCRQIAQILICECVGRAEGLGLTLRCVGASCVVWPGLGYTSSAPDLQWRRLITARRFTPTSASHARARAPTQTPACARVSSHRKVFRWRHSMRFPVESRWLDVPWSRRWWCGVLDITQF